MHGCACVRACNRLTLMGNGGKIQSNFKQTHHQNVFINYIEQLKFFILTEH